MKNLLNPKWLIVINIIPTVILLLLFYSQYNMIKSLLSTKTAVIWLDFSLILILFTIAQLVYTLYSIYKKYNISIFYAFFNLLIYTIFLYAYAQYTDELMPFSIPQWMINVDVVLYPGTFLMPTLVHSLFILVEFSSRKSRSSSSAWLSFLYGIAIPISGYVFLQIVLPLWQKTESGFDSNALMILLIVASILFLFFICRGIYILTNLNAQKLSTYTIFLKILIAIVFPIVGLLVNNGGFILNRGFGTSIFGNFSSIWFYIIALINGVLVCLPNFKNLRLRLLRFLGLAICFPYTLYFFLVFLPYLPLSVVAVIAIGVGFLMLSPLFLFILQINGLHKDFTALCSAYSMFRLSIFAGLALLLIPALITVSYLRDKYILHEALAYVYSPDYEKNYNIDRKSLAKILAVVQQNKGRNNFFAKDQTPFLTPYYNWLVLDNLILSESKINTLEAIFLGKPTDRPIDPIAQVKGKVKISKISSNSKFDEKQQAWISTIDLELTNPETLNLESYETEFTLPEGCWIGNFYLNIGNKKEFGILAEKKAALWVFSQIRNENRDPGILYYLTGNKIAFKVFPFSAKETRKSGITFIHKAPVNFKIDGKSIFLGDNSTNHQVKTESINGSIYLPLAEKTKLKLVKRKPEYHFIIDVSKDHGTKKTNYIKRISNFVSSNQIQAENISLNFASTFNEQTAYSSDWKDKFNKRAFEGGFYLEGAIKKILIDHYKANRAAYPVMIVVSDSLENSILQNDFADLKIAFPEGDHFYELDQQGKLWRHSLTDQPKNRLNTVEKIRNPSVYCWPDLKNPKAYLAADQEASIIIDLRETNKELIPPSEKQWLSGLNLKGLWLKHQVNGKQSDVAHLDIIKTSMLSGILSPNTSYLVVENQAQKMALKKKQEQVLSGNKNLDPDEETQRMNEPNLDILILLLTVVSLYLFRDKINISWISSDKSTYS
ncbi:MSEP-CTERM sorting domain-containing protein [Pedobacter sp. KLB.chiD]|uniref:MSEP-CTERM sorting domain-containing protein n=1 Tax=Pedobacter sp. KLB.chiD TaxID=3387402 RepID=UPI00399BD6DA